nr:MAG: hypothetical protein TU35_07515 [Thermoproteus sp. AZ2]
MLFRALSAISSQHAEIKQTLERDLQLMPEAVDGLINLYLGTEDYTCMTAKKLAGKRDKGVMRSNAFRL